MDKRLNVIERGYILEKDLEYCNFLLGTHKEKFYQKAGFKFSIFSAYVKTFSTGSARFVRSATQLYVQTINSLQNSSRYLVCLVVLTYAQYVCVL
jgi:hypothetical protein